MRVTSRERPRELAANAGQLIGKDEAEAKNAAERFVAVRDRIGRLRQGRTWTSASRFPERRSSAF
jgi:hypothetical protein